MKDNCYIILLKGAYYSYLNYDEVRKQQFFERLKRWIESVEGLGLKIIHSSFLTEGKSFYGRYLENSFSPIINDDYLGGMLIFEGSTDLEEIEALLHKFPDRTKPGIYLEIRRGLSMESLAI